MQKKNQSDYYYGKALSVSIEPNPEGKGRAAFKLLITAQRGEFIDDSWAPRVGERPYVYELDASGATLRQMQKTLLKSTEKPSVKDILLDIRQSLEQLARHVPDV